MRIDKVNVDLYVEVPDLFDNLGLTTEQAASSVRDALAMVLSNALAGIAVRTAETLTEDEWLAEQARLAQGCGECDGCKAQAAIEAEWANEHGFAI
jgi:hypothetical protein